jgi:hypothetical protein
MAHAWSTERQFDNQRNNNRTHRTAEHPLAHRPLFSESDFDNLGYQYFGGGRQNYAGLESGAGPLADYDYPELDSLVETERPPFAGDWYLTPPTGDFRGRGPKNYQRSDERIREDVCERLTDDPYVDVSEVSVQVQAGVVVFEGAVAGRLQKYRIEDIAERCSGVKDIQNRVMVSQRPQ